MRRGRAWARGGVPALAKGAGGKAGGSPRVHASHDPPDTNLEKVPDATLAKTLRLLLVPSRHRVASRRQVVGAAVIGVAPGARELARGGVGVGGHSRGSARANQPVVASAGDDDARARDARLVVAKVDGDRECRVHDVEAVGERAAIRADARPYGRGGATWEQGSARRGEWGERGG